MHTDISLSAHQLLRATNGYLQALCNKVWNSNYELFYFEAAQNSRLDPQTAWFPLLRLFATAFPSIGILIGNLEKANLKVEKVHESKKIFKCLLSFFTIIKGVVLISSRLWCCDACLETWCLCRGNLAPPWSRMGHSSNAECGLLQVCMLNLDLKMDSLILALAAEFTCIQPVATWHVSIASGDGSQLQNCPSLALFKFLVFVTSF